VLLRDEDITRQPAHVKAQRGLSLVPEGRRIFGTLTVFENLRLAAHRTRDRQRVANLVRTVVASFPGLERHLEAPAGRLSGGEQQQLAIGRALMTEPELLLLDEPSLGLAPQVTDTIFDSFEDLREQGVSMLLVEQNARRTVEVADRTYVLRNGVITTQGQGAKLLESSDIRDLYAGLADD
jgi:branched-chain amino acid transport system ATP-binding protein